ncbi:MAG: Orotate phosphoribosyltransferase [Microgenomates bacterium OLB23]|nr:MAG: Orotate phosphoribosyltransferase [Microgenomates bacterium OLB23]
MEHPEGLTSAQEKLADLLFTTKTRAKVRRRSGAPGAWEFVQIERDTSPVDFAQEGEFVLKLHETQPDAPLSPIYFNLRNLPEVVLHQMALAMADIPDKEKPAFCVGIPQAGEPIGLAYAAATGIPHVQILEKKETPEGRTIVPASAHKNVHGPVRVIDDLVTQGHTKIETINAIRTMGIAITDLTVLIDREQGARADLAAAGVELRAVFTMKQLLNYFLRVGHIDQARYAQVTAYMQGSI